MITIDFLIKKYYNKKWLILHPRIAKLNMRSDIRKQFLRRNAAEWRLA